MLMSKLLGKKRIKLDSILGKSFTDLIYSTFRYPLNNSYEGVAIVNEYEKMRPDSVCNRIYGDQSKWDVMLKYNGISNPFSLDVGDVLHATSAADLESSYTAPNEIAERLEYTDSDASNISTNTVNNTKDSSRLANLKNKKGELPPNINRVGDKNVKVKDGRLIFGEDVTTVNKKNCQVPISRTRLKMALTKNKLFG